MYLFLQAAGEAGNDVVFSGNGLLVRGCQFFEPLHLLLELPEVVSMPVGGVGQGGR